MLFKKKYFFFVFVLTIFTSYTLVDKWHKTESKTLGYSIEFPQKPESTIQEIKSGIGVLKLNMFIYEVTEKSPSDDNQVYLVNCTEFPDSLVSSDNTALLEGFYRGTIDGAGKEIGGTVTSEKKIELNGYAGREVTIAQNEEKSIITMRLYLVKNRLFMLETITQKNKVPNKSITRFFNSFQLI